MTKSRRPDKLNVFICSAKEDLAKAREIYFKLVEEPWIRPWLYAENISPGQEWEKEISKEMLNAHAIIVCLSKKAVAREGYFQKEIRDALDIAKEIPQENIFIIPLIMTDCTIPQELRHLYRLKYLDPNEHYEKLRQSLFTRAQSVKVRTDKPQSVKQIDKKSVPDLYIAMPKKLAMLILDEDINNFDSYQQNVIRFVLSRLLDVDEEYIAIRYFFGGSVRVVIELPEKVHEHLDFLWRNKDKNLLRLLRLRSFISLERDELRTMLSRDFHADKLFIDLRPASDLFSGMPIGNEIFVGREGELGLFQQMLKEPYGDKRILLLLGGGGIGKTRLVREMLREQQAGILIAREPIDLFSTDYRHIDGIQWKIKDIVEELSTLKDSMSPLAGWVEGKTDTSEQFYECLKRFCAKQPLVLAFDTFENLDRVASNWLFKGEPNGLQVPGLICIVAGRDNEIADIDVYRKNELVRDAYLSGFTTEKADDFYRKITEANQVENDQTQEVTGPYDDLLKAAGLPKDYSLENSIEWIIQITNGHPLRLEMIFQWLGTLLGDESLKDLSVEKFDERLMMQVRELAERGQLDAGAGKKVSQPVYDTLLCMAYITRRFDEGFLQYFRDQKLIHIEDPDVTNQDIISNLEHYFFVKIRDGNSGHNFLQLHDEMARLVRKYVWPYWDNSGEKKQTLLDAVVKYYDQLIADSTGEDVDALRIEKLYYTFLRNGEEGLRQWFKLAEEGNENINKLLPGEIKKYISNNYYDDATLVQVHSKIAEMERNAGHIRQAIGHWERVQEFGEKNQREDWVVDALVGLFNCKWMTEPKQALEEYLKPAQTICEKQFPERLALIYYEIAFAYRQMQDFEQAVEWYKKGIQSFQELPEDNPLEAILYNDMGYAYLILGRWGDAAKNLTEALNIREERWHEVESWLRDAPAERMSQLQAEQSQTRLFVGLSRNTLGEYHRYVSELDEAVKDYEQAYEHFDAINDYYWQAKCLGAKGETYRRLAWQAWEKKREDSVIQEYLDKAMQDVEESLYLCEKYQLDDERDTAYRRLGRISHDLGLIAHERGEVKQALERLEEAYAYFKQGLEYAEKTNDTLEELENLTELAFLADDSVVFYGQEAVPDYYHRAVDELKAGLKKHRDDPQRIYLYPVFEALWKMEQAAIALSEGDYKKALKGYVEAFRGLGIFPGYGHARYRQHFGHLTQQIESLPREEQARWCREFIDVWKKTKMPGREDKTLADGLLPDLFKWCNRLLQSTV